MFVWGLGIAKRFWFESGKFCHLNPFFANSLLTSTPPGKTTCVHFYTDKNHDGDENYNSENQDFSKDFL